MKTHIAYFALKTESDKCLIIIELIEAIVKYNIE